ncbi:hypothetical protein [Paraherbaspirillum soli]|uniref:Uncharacterized protein n=1 Tax=Paraherbaspirillum soli TaxID=631222 RepID=A0ABW0MAF7_9BURK
MEFSSLILTPLGRALTLVGTLRPAALVVAMALLAGTSAYAQNAPDPSPESVDADPAAALTARYPAGSITSVEKADQALTDVVKARAAVEARSLEEQRVCYEKFFVNDCLDVSKERRRLAMKAIRPVDVAANAFKRRARADERDKALEEQRAKDEVEMPKRAQEQKEKELANVEKMKQGADKNKEVEANSRLHAGEADKRAAEHNARLQKAEQERAAKAQQRAANVAAFEKKAQESAARQREIAAKKAEKARALANKKASTQAPVPAATPAGGAATTPTSPASTP